MVLMHGEGCLARPAAEPVTCKMQTPAAAESPVFLRAL
jgi:hypothetical protein